MGTTSRDSGEEHMANKAGAPDHDQHRIPPGDSEDASRVHRGTSLATLLTATLSLAALGYLALAGGSELAEGLFYVALPLFLIVSARLWIRRFRADPQPFLQRRTWAPQALTTFIGVLLVHSLATGLLGYTLDPEALSDPAAWGNSAVLQRLRDFYLAMLLPLAVASILITRLYLERKAAQALSRTTEALNRQILSSIDEIFLAVDRQWRITYANPKAELLNEKGLPLLGSNFWEVAPDAAGPFHEVFGQAMRANESVTMERYYPPLDSWFQCRLYPHADGMVISLLDVSDRHQARIHRDLALAVVENTRDAIVMLDAELKLTSVNPAMQGLSGLPEKALLGTGVTKLLPQLSPDNNADPGIWDCVADSGYWTGELELTDRTGQSVQVWTSISPIRGNDTTAGARYVLVLSDISELQRAREQAEFLAYHDPLTRLPNRQLCHDRLDKALARARRHRRKVAGLFIDLDRFKEINDSLGHSVGDAVLCSVAERIGGRLRCTDTLARLSGDEFFLILEELEDSSFPERLARELVADLSQPFTLGEQDVSISLSIGIAIGPEDGDDPGELIQRADAAMYEAKVAGRNGYRFFNPRRSVKSSEQRQLRLSVQQAIEQHEFIIHFQPQISLKGPGLTGMEALVRWLSPEHGLVLPGRFIPVAERNGLIGQLETQVMEMVRDQIECWHQEGIEPTRIAINLSAQQISEPEIADRIMESLPLAALHGWQIELELTETAVMKNPSLAKQNLERLKAAGYQLALDDFGTGYSSLSHLKRFPFDRLKIDRSFVRDLATDHQGVVLVQTIIGMADNLGMEVVAEGVESGIQEDILRNLECHEAQGYFYFEPLPPQVLSGILKSTPRADTNIQVSEQNVDTALQRPPSYRQNG